MEGLNASLPSDREFLCSKMLATKNFRADFGESELKFSTTTKVPRLHSRAPLWSYMYNASGRPLRSHHHYLETASDFRTRSSVSLSPQRAVTPFRAGVISARRRNSLVWRTSTIETLTRPISLPLSVHDAELPSASRTTWGRTQQQKQSAWPETSVGSSSGADLV